MNFKRNRNTDYLFNTLTSNKINQMSAGRIPKMSPQQASGLIGSWMVETGDPTLQNLDVVEKVAGAGRGLSQYTGTRRIPYDLQRSQALSQGVDVNSPEWQLQYFADEYSGKFDQQGRSLIGWTQNLERAPQNLSPAEYAQYYTGSAQEGTGYFRPGVPHTERRRQAAEQVFKAYGVLPPQPEQTILNIPQIKQGPPVKATPTVESNPLSIIVDSARNFLGI